MKTVTQPPTVTKAGARRWDALSIGWMCIALLMPVYRVLPGSIQVAWVMGTLGLIVVSVALGKVARPLYAMVWIIAGYGALVAILTATTEGTVEENVSTGAQLFVLLGLGAFVMTSIVRENPHFIRTISTVFLTAQTVSSLAGIAQVAGIPVLGWSVVQGRAPGLAGHPNVLGMLSCVAILLCLHHLVYTRTRRLLTMAIALINIGGLLATGSLSALFAGALGILVAAICMRGSIKNLLRIIVGTVVLSWLVVQFTDFADSVRTPADRYLQVTGQTRADGTWEIRKRTYQFAWEGIKEHPLFGNGLSANHGATFDGVTLTHNVFLRAWYQGGIMLALGIGLIVLTVVGVAIRSMIHKENGLAAGVLVAVMGFALTSAFFEQSYYWLPVLVAWAAISQRAGRARTDSAIPRGDIGSDSSPRTATATSGT
ncbi:O-antigen ligase family protein [Rhodococcus opacus]|uniref:O-antigen ligase family protein n=1 Tax=Rhodococcus opacus TaxID=37919 RepID=UPI0034D289F5